jgi:hypothetical protein
MALKAFIYHILAITFLVLPIVSSANFSFPTIFNFGDSNSDTGGLAAGIAFPLGPPNGQTFFLKPSGRFSDGRLIIDFLSNVSLTHILLAQKQCIEFEFILQNTCAHTYAKEHYYYEFINLKYFYFLYIYEKYRPKASNFIDVRDKVE